MSQFSSFDIVVGLLLLALAWRGWSRGIITQVASVLGLVIGWIVALRGSEHLAPLIPLQEPLRNYVAMVLLFVGAMVATYFLGRFVRGLVSLIALGWADKLVGMALGIVKGGLVVVLVVFGAVMLSDAAGRWVTRSMAGPISVAVIRTTERLIPADVCKRLHNQLAKFDQKVGVISDGASEAWTFPALQNGLNAEVDKMTAAFGHGDAAQAITQRMTAALTSESLKTPEGETITGWIASAIQSRALPPPPAIPDESSLMIDTAIQAATRNEPPPMPLSSSLSSPLSSSASGARLFSAGGSVASPAAAPLAAPPSPPPTATPLFDPATWAEALKR